MTISAQYTGAGVAPTSMTAAAAGPIIECTFNYDYPHISTSSGKTAINAHLVGSCTAPVTSLLVRSTMCFANRDKCGSMDIGANGGKSVVSTGADLACGTAARHFQAHGDWSVIWPPGYVPISPQSGDIESSSRGPFKRNGNGVCVNA